MSLENSPSFLLNFSECEMNGEANHFYLFKSFRLDVAERQLLHKNSPVALTPKAFDVLAVLVERGGHLIEKEELLKSVWADSFVEEANIARIIHTLRKVLGEDENGNKFIETVTKKGYRFVAEVEEIHEPIAQKSTNNKSDFSVADEKSAEAIFEEKPVANEETSVIAFQTSSLANDKIAVPLSSKPKQKTKIILFSVGFASAIFLIFLLSFNWQLKSSVNPNEPQSIAVLPLKSLTAENRDSIYELGIADSLILKLSTVKNLIVRPLSATQEYADTRKDATAIGREQNVDYVFASNYQIADGKIRITSQLINVATGTVEETFKNEQNISTYFAVQDAFAADVGQKLLTRLNRSPNDIAAKRYTINEEAYRLFLLGRALTDKRTKKDAEKAIENFEQAVRLDPNYALAYAALADAYGVIGMSGGDKSETYLKQKAAIEKALAIDENLAEAHSQLGMLKMNYEWDFDVAERAYKRAVELNPGSATIHREYAIYLNSMGRFDESIAEIKIAIDLEPALVMNHRNYGMILYYARRYEEAIIQLNQTIEMDSRVRGVRDFLCKAYRMKGEDDKAFKIFLQTLPEDKENTGKIESWKMLYAQSGWNGILRRQIEEADAEGKGKSDWDMANLYGELGNKEKAFAYIEKDLPRRGWGWTIIKINPSLDSLRSDPRFEEIVRRVGLK